MRNHQRAYLRRMDYDEFEPGSPRPLYLFARWCRAAVELEVLQFVVPTLLFIDGADLEEPLVEQWQTNGRTPSREELLSRLIPSAASRHLASQVGASVPFGGPQPGIFLLAVDETGAVAEQSYVVIEHDHLELGSWAPVGTATLPLEAWQRVFALHAGYEEFVKWRCRRCQSVCPGEAAVYPAPCDFCGSNDIEEVTLATPLAPPRTPYESASFAASFGEVIGWREATSGDTPHT
jgi:hypothetical protein